MPGRWRDSLNWRRSGAAPGRSWFIIGEGATELIHIGQAVLNLNGTVDYFVENTFNYPTLAEAYKAAGLDAFNKMPKPVLEDKEPAPDKSKAAE